MSLPDSEIDAVLARAVADGAVPGVVAAVTDRRGTIHEAAFGTASDGARLEVDAVFRLASMTKLVTSIAVLMLHEEGRVDIGARFGDYVPGYAQPEVLDEFDAATGRYATRPARRAITVRDLLTHTSGYGYWFLDAPLRAVQGTVAPNLFEPPFLVDEPGARFAYGTSTDVLGLLVEPVAGASLETFFAERIFTPLGMCDTSFRPPADATRLVPVHYRTAGGFAELANETTGPAPRGGGGLYGTARDYASLLRMLLNGGRAGEARVLAAETVRALTSNQIGELAAARQTTVYPERTNDFLFMDGTQKFGFGVLVETVDGAGGRRAGSYGWGGIVNTYFWADPESGLGAVLMMQLKPFCDRACIAVYEAFEHAVYREIGARGEIAPSRAELG